MEKKTFKIDLKDAHMASRNKRAKRAMSILKDFLKKNLKAEKLNISPFVNQKIWENGARNPPLKIEVQSKEDGGIFYIELADRELVLPKIEKKKVKKKKEVEKEERAEEEKAKEHEEKKEVKKEKVKREKKVEEEERPEGVKKMKREPKEEKVRGEKKTEKAKEEKVETGKKPEKEKGKREKRPKKGEPSGEIQKILLEGNIEEAKEAVKKLHKSELNAILNFEKKNKNRKELIRFLESNMR